jgi:hypothetical protein
MSGAVVDFRTVTPKFVTSIGAYEACVTRDWARIRSVLGSVFTSKFTISVVDEFPVAFKEYIIHLSN